MGREWYFNWGSKSSKKAGVKGEDGKKGVRPKVATVAAAAAASGGCMNGVLHMFDFNHFHLCLHPQDGSYLPNEATILKGVEAPRNSLESIGEGDKKDCSLHIRKDIQIKTNRRDTDLKVVVPDSDSPASGARTPTLVARLMGLDVLPESNYSTPRSSSSTYTHLPTHSPHIKSSTPPSKTRKTRKKTPYKSDNVVGTQSLPDSPKSSSSSQRTMRSTNVIEQHRLSLQINKENSIVKEMESSRPSCSAINTKRREGRKYEDDNKSPGFYAKQIMRQVKETVSRRVGSDITNTVGQREIRRDENLLNAKTLVKSNKARLTKTSDTSKKVTEKLCSVTSEVLKYDDKLEVKPYRSKNEKRLKHEPYHCPDESDGDFKKFGFNGSTNACPKKPPLSKSYEPIKSKKDEQFVIRPPTRANNSATEKKSKKTPLSSDLVHGSVPSVVPLKKNSSSSLQAHPKFIEEQDTSKAQMIEAINNISTAPNTAPRLSRNPGQWTFEKVQEEATYRPTDHEKTNALVEFQYISKILKCTGIDRDTPIISFTKWFSPLHPLNPTIYHNLELTHYLIPTNIDNFSPFDFNPSHSINRKLIFHLVDEILADILNSDHEYHHREERHLHGLQLVTTLCNKIKSYPSANCETLQDIDALVEKDIPRHGTTGNTTVFQEEDEAIVKAIEGHIVDSLVQEIAMFLLG